ncbi:hypothetical protein [Pseudochelatococcus contaminans]|uniref:Uncharacterized protein n=1 Tax=Pseudochelatococcus contaminans TaxID=1538103 RepID=A0A7W5Z2V6_9HYPH|nr:hypothetical protein [Pseudochelatococcus contaminans]MBB3808794.1 hypothetical protein [Pseudochelatococcus contaminans]
MSAPTPLPFVWDGEAFRPINRYFARLCDKYFVVGEKYDLESIEARSGRSHRHYFAAIREAWENLPEHMAGDFPSDEHLRKFALIKAGYRDVRSIVASSKAEAHRLAAFIKPMDEYALVAVEAATVTVATAQSQSTRAMGKEAFQASKTDVLEYLSDLIGVAPAELQERARAA